MRDVAKVAGVSVATVSHVVNDKQGARIGDDARERVQPRHRASSATGRTPWRRTSSRHVEVSSAWSPTRSPRRRSPARSSTARRTRRGSTATCCWSRTPRATATAEDEAIAMMLEHQVRGILYSTWYHRAAEIPPALLETDVVLVDCFSEGGEAAGSRARRGAGRPHRHRPARRRRPPSHRVHQHDDPLARARRPTRGVPGARSRRRASRSTSRSCSMRAPSRRAATTPSRRSSIAVPRRCSATTTAWRWASTTACASTGCRIPSDVAVIGFDNQDVIAAHLRPPLSTVALPHYELGAAGVRMLLGLEAAPEGGRLEVACPPVVRSSI